MRAVGFLSLALLSTLSACQGQDTGATQVDSAPVQPAQQVQPAQPAALLAEPRGEAVYRRYCVVCHHADGRGKDGMSGADLAGDPSRLSRTDEELVQSVRDGLSRGTVTMPPHKSILTEREIRDVIAYVRDRFGPRRP